MFTTSDFSARLQQALALLFPSNLAAKAALFAVVVALLPTSQAPRLWELPHLLLLGVIISYGVFGQKNADAAEVSAAAKVEEPSSVEAYVSEMMQAGSFAFGRNDRDVDTDDDGANKDGGGVQAWSAQYLPPDDHLVVVAESVMRSSDGKGGAGDEKPLHLPVRKLKPADEVMPTTTLKGEIISDGIIEEEKEEEELREFIAPKAVIVRERAIPSPSSVLDADLSLSPSSPSSPPLLPPPPPPPPPFLRSRLQKAKAKSFNEFVVGDRSMMSGRRSLGSLQSAGNRQQFRSKSSVHATRRNDFTIGYDDPTASSTGYEDAAADDDNNGEFDDEMVPAGAASDDSSFSSDDMLTDDNDHEEGSYGAEEEEEEYDGNSMDEELFELATRPGPDAGDDETDEVEDEVDRKAEEFIAKFRDQIRMQRVVEPARRR